MSWKVYCDGSVLPTNPGFGGWGWHGVCTDTASIEKGSGHADLVTNNQMELMAAISALESLPPGRVIVTSDSAYVVNGAKTWVAGWKRKGWKTAEGKDVANKDLWIRLDEAIQEHAQVVFEWVRGHNGDPGNEEAHRLAEGAARARYAEATAG